MSIGMFHRLSDLILACLLLFHLPIEAAEKPPNILIILADDLGYSDIGCYGGEIDTPNLDRLASNGIRYSSFYNTSKCWTTRASLLTGQYYQHVTVGNGLKPETITLADRLGEAGYSTYLSGKWHLNQNRHDDPSRNPLAFGFDHYFGNLHGAVSYFNPYTLMRGTESAAEEITDDFYLTDAISNEAVRNVRDHFASETDKPLFLYMAYTAPHWPLHALPEDIAKYRPRYKGKSFSAIRSSRYERMQELGVLPKGTEFSKAAHQPWNTVDESWNTESIAVYAAMLDRMDQGVGKVIQALEETGQLENTVICFFADNGACHEDIGYKNGLSCLGGTALTRDGRPITISGEELPGGETTFQGYGPNWANVSNTPYRFHKSTSYEGGIRSPFILHWPAGVPEEKRGTVDHDLISHLIDLSPTFLHLAGESVPAIMDGVSVHKQWKGESDSNPKRVLFNDFGKGSMMYDYPWKLVEYKGSVELYNLESDPSETRNLAAIYADRFQTMKLALEAWKASFVE